MDFGVDQAGPDGGVVTRRSADGTGNLALDELRRGPGVGRVADRAADHDVGGAGAGGVEIGAGWSKTSEAQRPYVSIKLDEPSFAASIYCRLIGRDDGSHLLVWSR